MDDKTISFTESNRAYFDQNTYVCPKCGDIGENVIHVTIKGMEATYCLVCLVKHYCEILQKATRKE